MNASSSAKSAQVIQHTNADGYYQKQMRFSGARLT